MHEANLRQARLEDEIGKVENENRVEIGSAKRKFDQLQEYLDEVQMEKENAKRKCLTLTKENEVII